MELPKILKPGTDIESAVEQLSNLSGCARLRVGEDVGVLAGSK